MAAVVAMAIAASVLLLALSAWHAALAGVPEVASAVLPYDVLHLAATDAAHPFLENELIEQLGDDPRVAELVTARRVRVIDLPGTPDGKLDEELFLRLREG